MTRIVVTGTDTGRYSDRLCVDKTAPERIDGDKYD